MQNKNRAVIMAGADIQDYSFYKAMPCDYVICADRGYLHAKKLDIVANVLLGDFDSLSIPLPENIETITYPAEKDETDLQIAIQYALSKGFSDIYVIGAFGGRADHFLGNVCLLKWAKDRGASLVMEDKDTRIKLLSGELYLPKREGFYLSIIPFFGNAIVSMEGVKYPLQMHEMKLGDTLGLSNEITGNKAKIYVHQGLVLVLECRIDKQ